MFRTREENCEVSQLSEIRETNLNDCSNDMQCRSQFLQDQLKHLGRRYVFLKLKTASQDRMRGLNLCGNYLQVWESMPKRAFTEPTKQSLFGLSHYLQRDQASCSHVTFKSEPEKSKTSNSVYQVNCFMKRLIVKKTVMNYCLSIKDRSKTFR